MPSISFFVGRAPGRLADGAVGDAAERLAADLGAHPEGRRQEIERLVGTLHHVERARQAERADELDAMTIGECARPFHVDLLGPQQRDFQQADAELLEPLDLRFDAAEIPDRRNGECVQSKYVHQSASLFMRRGSPECGRFFALVNRLIRDSHRLNESVLAARPEETHA